MSYSQHVTISILDNIGKKTNIDLSNYRDPLTPITVCN